MVMGKVLSSSQIEKGGYLRHRQSVQWTLLFVSPPIFFVQIQRDGDGYRPLLQGKEDLLVVQVGLEQQRSKGIWLKLISLWVSHCLVSVYMPSVCMLNAVGSFL